jgi:hypothetical protein
MTVCQRFGNPLNFGGLEMRLTARAGDRRGNSGYIGEIVSKHMACRIKSLFGEEEKLLHCESKDCARNLAKRVDSQKDADLNSHQQPLLGRCQPPRMHLD